MSVLYQLQQRAATSVPDIADLSFDLDSMECFDDIDIKMEDLESPNEEAGAAYQTAFLTEELEEGGSVALFEFDRMRDLTLDLDAVVSRGGEKRSLLLEDMDSGRDQLIRQDCMWSSVHSQSVAKFFKTEAGQDSRRGLAIQPANNSSSSTSLLGLTPPTSYIHQHILLRHQFETPMASADEDASGDDDEIMENAGFWSNSLMDAVSRLSTVPLNTAAVEPLSASRDHSYFSCSSSKKPASSATSVLTPPESSEDEDSYQGIYVSRNTATELSTKTPRSAGTVRRDSSQLQQSVSSILATQRRSAASATALLPRSKPKFTFRINISSTAASKKLNRLVRSRSRHGIQHQRAALVRAAVEGGSASVVTSSIRLQERPNTSLSFSDEECRYSPGQEPKGARDLHNHNERQRRTDLKNAFDYLKRRVPAIASSERVSKQMILDKAIDFCRNLKAKESSVRQHHKLLAERNELLRKKIASLKLAKIV